jgi:hypothetical protein
MLMAMTQKKAQPELSSHGCGSPPSPVMTPFSSPSRCRIHFHTSATTTGDSSTG